MLDNAESKKPKSATATTSQTTVLRMFCKNLKLLQVRRSFPKIHHIINQMFINMIDRDMQLVSLLLKTPTSKDFVGDLEFELKKNDLPSRRTIMQDMLSEVYRETRWKLARVIHAATSIALTTHIWTSCQTPGVHHSHETLAWQRLESACCCLWHVAYLCLWHVAN